MTNKQNNWKEEFKKRFPANFFVTPGKYFSARNGYAQQDDVISFIESLISRVQKQTLQEVEEEGLRHAKTLSALASMWNQYCSKEIGHEFMSAGEEASEVLERYGLLKTIEGKKSNAMYGNMEVDYPLTIEYIDYFLSAIKQELD